MLELIVIHLKHVHQDIVLEIRVGGLFVKATSLVNLAAQKPTSSKTNVRTNTVHMDFLATPTLDYVWCLTVLNALPATSAINTATHHIYRRRPWEHARHTVLALNISTEQLGRNLAAMETSATRDAAHKTELASPPAPPVQAAAHKSMGGTTTTTTRISAPV